MKKKLVICGGGSSAHTLIPFLKDSIFDVSILTSRPEKWKDVISLEYRDPQGNLVEHFSGPLVQASSEPSELIPNADYIILCMPVHQYRVCLDRIAPYIKREEKVFVGTVYGQAGFNWMVNEIKEKYVLSNIVTFAFGLLPWICRIVEYGHIGITYGGKAVNYAACYPRDYFDQINNEFFEQVTFRWFGKGHTVQSDNFLSLTLSVDNQIIHTSRCLGLYKKDGGRWSQKDLVPLFYKDYDDLSADLLKNLDNDYSKVRREIVRRFPKNDYRYMLDYLSLERFSYQSDNTDIKESFVNSQTLTSIGTPVIQLEDGSWQIDRNHRFFLDDIYYGNCICKWMAQKLDILVPTVDEILRWAQDVRGESIIDSNNCLILDSKDLDVPYKTGIPSVYGFKSIEDCVIEK